jgi:hypothetical protein
MLFTSLESSRLWCAIHAVVPGDARLQAAIDNDSSVQDLGQTCHSPQFALSNPLAPEGGMRSTLTRTGRLI